MKNPLAGIVIGLALVAPACSTPTHGGVAYASIRISAYDEGFRHGLSDGRWAASRYRGPYRNGFWDDGRNRSASNGYRSHYGSKAEFSRGFRAGYEQGYWERRGNRGRY